jgi:dienelactone hydrolase
MYRNSRRAARAAIVALVVAHGSVLAQQADPRTLPVVYTAPGVETVVVRKNVPFKSSGDTSLTLDVYEPAGTKAGARLPAVVFVNGVGLPDLKDWRVYGDWARLVAARGFVAINHQSTAADTAADVRAAVEYVRANAATLKVDENRIGIWSCSANVRVALPFALDPSRGYVRCAIFYYGVMNEKPGRDDVPVLVARAGLDSPSLNAGIDRFLEAAIAQDLPLVVINYPEGQHAFDIFDDTDRSKLYVRQTLDFLEFHLTHDLSPQERLARSLSPARFSRLVAEQGWQKAREFFDAHLATHPYAFLFREQAMNGIGYQLIQTGRPKDAVEAFKLNAARFPESPNAYDSLADAYEAVGEKALAIENARRALEKLAAASSLPEVQRASIRRSAEEKLARLRTP